MNRSKLVAGVVVALTAMSLLGACGSSGDAQGGKKHYKIAIFQQVDAASVTMQIDGFKQAFFEKSGLSQDQVEWIPENARGDNNKCTTIAAQLAKMNLDMVVGSGTPCIVAMATQDTKVPIITVGVGDPVASKLADSIEVPGHNVTGAWRGKDYATPVIDGVMQLKPAPTHIGMIYDSGNDAMASWVKNAQNAAKAHNVKLDVIGVATANDIPAAARSLAGRVDAFVLPPDGLALVGVPAVVSAAGAAKPAIPVYVSGLSTGVATPGVVADIGQSFPELGRQAGLIAVKVLIDGADPAKTPFVTVDTYDWTINDAEAKRFGIEFPASIADKAMHR